MSRPRSPACGAAGAAALLLVLPALLLDGCGGPPPVVVPPEAPPGYLQLRETFGPRDFGPLAGRRIVLDPGHGGFFRGAIGPGGLAEADVNLGVALNLRGLLEWAGAKVFMTRTADYDFLTPADSTLASDLAFRVSFTDSIKPDVFISIHHNSTASGDPTINETQTYYPLDDDGASVDLAKAIHRHLVLNLEIEPARILPGNFRVLRDATCPAVLGEPAMISHPVMAGRLSQAAAQRLEAEAYFLGLLDYFAGGNPRWRAAQPDTVIAGAAPLPLAWTFTDSSPAAPAPDPATFTVRADGRRVDATLSPDGRELRWLCPAPVRGGPRRITVTGRNLAGRRTPSAVTVVRPARAATVVLDVISDPPGRKPRLAHLACAGPAGRPLPRGAVGWPALGTEGLLVLGDGPAAAAVVRRGDGPPVFVAGPDSARLEVRTRTLPAGLVLVPVADPGPRPWRIRLGGDPAWGPLAGGAVRRAGAALWGESRGRLPLLLPAAGDTAGAVTPAPLVPALEGVTVVVDPAGGGDDPDGAGPLGLRGADVNLAVARRLVRLLEGCGATAILTRDEGEVPTSTAKVALADAVGADWFLTVGRTSSADSVTVHHHPGSPTGTAWARRAGAAATALLPGAGVAVVPSWSYLLRHTACPALEIRLPGPSTAADELRLDRPAWQAAEARALLAGLAAAAADSALPAADPGLLLPGLPGAPAPAAVTWALWDGNLPWYPLPPVDGAPAGSPVSSWSEPGLPASGPVHTLEVHTDDTWQLWRLDRAADGTWTGTLVHAAAPPTRQDG